MRPTLAAARVLLLSTLLGLGASPAWAAPQGTPPPPDPPPATAVPQAPVATPNLDRIREAISRPASVTLDNGRMRIYVEIIAKWPRFDELVKGYDLRNGPTRGGAVMTHQEFLAMVTPREMYGSGGIRATEMLQVALVNWLGQALVKKGLEEIKNARSEREVNEIRARIERELAALRGGR